VDEAEAKEANGQMNIVEVTGNTIIFTTMACVISHHIGVYDAKIRSRSETKPCSRLAHILVSTTKQNRLELARANEESVSFRHPGCTLRHRMQRRAPGAGYSKSV
jgi:hypothetical protein